MNTAPSPIIRSIDQKPSLVDFYAIEAEFKAVESEYNTLVSNIDGTCLGVTSSTTECVKAEELNLRMQAFLVMLADILSDMKPMGEEYKEELDTQAQEVQNYIVKLAKQNTKIVAALDVAKFSRTRTHSSKIMLRQHQYEYVGWGIGTIVLAILIYRQIMRNK